MLRRVPGTSGSAAPSNLLLEKAKSVKICEQGGLGEAASRSRDAVVRARADFSLRVLIPAR